MPDIKLTDKQKEVVKLLRIKGNYIQWVDGLNPRVFMHHDLLYKISIPTVFKLKDLGVIEPNSEWYKPKFKLTELGKNIKL